MNTNIVIRGIDIKESNSESELATVYGGIRTHLGISNNTDFDPVSLKLLTSSAHRSSKSSRPIQVRFRSVNAKREFLQIRRVKKEILPKDIGIKQQSQRPVLISEQLTSANQQLLYSARSLRGGDKFKFVWSCNGQILARRQTKSKVIRLTSTAHVNLIRAQLGLEPLAEDGRYNTGAAI